MPDRRTVLTQLAAATGAAALSRVSVATDGALAPSAMRADIKLLRRAYEALHPGLYRYATPAGLDERFGALDAMAARPMSLPAFYLELSKLLATIRCGHSYANFFNQSNAVKAALFDAPDRLPFRFLWLDGRMVVTRDPTGVLAPGTEVLAVEGRPAGEIIAALLTVARADGGNDDKRRRLMSLQGEDGYESFDIFYPLLFGGRPRYQLMVRGPDGRRRAVAVDAISLAGRRAQRPPTVSAGDDTPVWTMERRGAVSVLTMPGWGLYNSKWDWRGWLATQFERLASDGARGLIIDIRANEGGLDDCIGGVAAPLIDKPTAISTDRRLVRYRRAPDDLRPNLDTWDRRFDDWGDSVEQFGARYFALTGREDAAGIVTPRPPRFTGRVAVLIGPQNSSATFGLARLVRRRKLGLLVGETTGGNRRGINGGAFYFLRLPETGLEVDLPLIGEFPRTPEPDAGIEPDVLVPTTPATIAAGRDEAMTRAIALVSA